MKANGKIQLLPFLRIAVCLILGIVVGKEAFPLVNVFYIFTAIFVLFYITFSLRQWSFLMSVALMTSTFLLGVLIVSLAQNRLKINLPSEPMAYQAVITNEPEDRGKTMRCNLLVVSINGKTCEKPFKIKASVLKTRYEKRHEKLRLGGGIMAYSQLLPSKSYYDNSNFDYATWLNIHGFVAQTFIYYNQWVQSGVDLSVLSHFERAQIRAMQLREKLISYYKTLGINAQQQAIVAAMTLGDKSRISDEITEAYSISGTSHILALSGSNLSMIYALLLFLFPWRKMRALSRCIIVAVIWLYVVLVGMEPSVVRAAVMVSVYSFATLLSRNNMSLNALFLTVVVMLMVNPLNLWDVGFQLSFVAVLAILVLYRPIYHALPLPDSRIALPIKYLWAMMSMSIAAQIGTAPLVLFYFERFSCYFLLSNLVVIPMSTLILYVTFFMLIFTPLPVVQQGISWFLSKTAHWLNDYVVWIASLPGASLDGVHINLAQTMLIYALMATGLMIIFKMKRPHNTLEYD